MENDVIDKHGYHVKFCHIIGFVSECSILFKLRKLDTKNYRKCIFSISLQMAILFRLITEMNAWNINHSQQKVYHFISIPGCRILWRTRIVFKLVTVIMTLLLFKMRVGWSSVHSLYNVTLILFVDVFCPFFPNIQRRCLLFINTTNIIERG